MTPDEFWARVDRSAGVDACWPWLGCTDANGYWWLRWQGKRARAHVVALLLDGRPVGEGQVGRHLCTAGVKRCCNPRHLAPGTRRDDAADRIAAGTQRNRRVLSSTKAVELAWFYLRGLATSPELGRLYGIAPDMVRRIGRRAFLAQRARLAAREAQLELL